MHVVVIQNQPLGLVRDISGQHKGEIVPIVQVKASVHDNSVTTLAVMSLALTLEKHIRQLPQEKLTLPKSRRLASQHAKIEAVLDEDTWIHGGSEISPSHPPLVPRTSLSNAP